MDEESRCQRCSAEVTAQAIGELCANCLLKLVLDPPHDETFGVDQFLSDATQGSQIRHFGDYELVEEIARGGMGVVYKARQVSLNRLVALKMILAGDFSSPAMVERFRTEAEAAARLEHPNIVPIYEIGEYEGQHFFSMPFVEGGTLTQALAKEKWSACQAAGLMVKVARAVHHAHQRGIIHRDIKPGNILLDKDAEPHITDFGLAKILQSDTALTQSAAVLGTPSYMAPEQAAGLTRQISTAADVYSLGAVLYELLTGQAPFRGVTATETMRWVMEQEPKRPRLLNPSVDRDLETIGLKCLEKNPARRYTSAEALAEDLERWLAHVPIQARPVGLEERVWKWVQRKPLVAALVAALHLVGLIGLVGVVWQGNRAKDQAALATLEARRANLEAQKARENFARAESELWNANFNEARAVRIAGGPGARTQSSALLRKLVQRPGLTKTQVLDLREEAIAQMALVDILMPTNWITEASDWSRAWNARLDRYAQKAASNRVELCEFPSGRVIRSFLGPPAGRFDQAVLSADDQWLAVRFSNARSEVRVWNIDTGEVVLRTVCEKLDNVQRLHISPDSRMLVCLTPQGVAVQPIAADSQRRLLQLDAPATSLAFAPDSERIAVVGEKRSHTVEIWNLHSATRAGSFQLDFPPRRVDWHPDGVRLLLGGDRGLLEQWSLTSAGDGKLLARGPLSFTGHIGFIDRLVLTSDGATALTYSWDSSSIIWDVVSGRPLLREHRLIFLGISTAGDRVLARQEPTRNVSVANLLGRTGFRTAAWAGAACESGGVWISPDSRLAVVNRSSSVARTEGELILWDFARGTELARLKGCWATFSADAQTLYTFERYAENRMRRHDLRPETLAKLPADWAEGEVVYRGSADEVINAGVLAPDGRTLVIAATDAVIFFDPIGRQTLRTWKKSAHTVSLSGDGHWLATARHHEPTVLRRADGNGDAFLRFPPYTRLRFSPDGRWMAILTHDSLKIFETARLRPDTRIPAYPAIALRAGTGLTPPLDFSTDSRIFAVAYNRTQVRLHETATGRELATLSPPNMAGIGGSEAVKFSPDGQWLLVVKDDGETVAWNLSDIQRELASLGLDWADGN